MMFPIMCPAFVPGLIPMQNQEQRTNLGAGLYAVPTFPFMPPMSGIPSNTLIPLNYTVPTRRTTAEGMHRAAHLHNHNLLVRENALGAAARRDGENAAQAEGQPGDENQGENENRPVENDNQVEPAEQNGFN
ncbi:hypothetical protein IFM89_019727 [Coptis chinensis]|uniref:Uncharacterized protein n=1 Tax=Coptis chinensis TaxID=261450 RepID=A0A835H3Z2_9MAGN|nr:hypothetical protein IFM89_019727 [Coptis chinensis]